MAIFAETLDTGSSESKLCPSIHHDFHHDFHHFHHFHHYHSSNIAPTSSSSSSCRNTPWSTPPQQSKRCPRRRRLQHVVAFFARWVARNTAGATTQLHHGGKRENLEPNQLPKPSPVALHGEIFAPHTWVAPRRRKRRKPLGPNDGGKSFCKHGVLPKRKGTRRSKTKRKVRTEIRQGGTD